jgi:hypothetical protein
VFRPFATAVRRLASQQPIAPCIIIVLRPEAGNIS